MIEWFEVVLLAVLVELQLGPVEPLVGPGEPAEPGELVEPVAPGAAFVEGNVVAACGGPGGIGPSQAMVPLVEQLPPRWFLHQSVQHQ